MWLFILGGVVVVPSPQILINLPQTYEKLHCLNGSAVSEILRYRQKKQYYFI